MGTDGHVDIRISGMLFECYLVQLDLPPFAEMVRWNHETDTGGGADGALKQGRVGRIDGLKIMVTGKELMKYQQI